MPRKRAAAASAEPCQSLCWQVPASKPIAADRSTGGLTLIPRFTDAAGLQNVAARGLSALGMRPQLTLIHAGSSTTPWRQLMRKVCHSLPRIHAAGRK